MVSEKVSRKISFPPPPFYHNQTKACTGFLSLKKKNQITRKWWKRKTTSKARTKLYCLLFYSVFIAAKQRKWSLYNPNIILLLFPLFFKQPNKDSQIKMVLHFKIQNKLERIRMNILKVLETVLHIVATEVVTRACSTGGPLPRRRQRTWRCHWFPQNSWKPNPSPKPQPPNPYRVLPCRPVHRPGAPSGASSLRPCPSPSLPCHFQREKEITIGLRERERDLVFGGV